jgi:hypothetical protein
MGRKRETIKSKLESNDYVVNREYQKVDFKFYANTTQVDSSTSIIIRNANSEAGKTSLGVVLGPLTDRVTALEEETARLEAAKADKCFVMAMVLKYG